jgi:RNA-directed DNA polymerase
MASPFKLVGIPKSGGGTRPLGIPSVSDRIAQMTIVLLLEPRLEPVFHENLYAYRPGRSAHDALSQARENCWRYDWVLDMDIKGFFDNISHVLLQKSLFRLVELPWVHLDIDRWLRAPYQKENGEQVSRTKGVPQGSVVGPVLANLFLHYAFDEWMRRHYPGVVFERYADDTICHCPTRQQAEKMKQVIKERLAQCELELNEAKTSRTDKDLEELAQCFNPSLQSWINYYGRFYSSALKAMFVGLNERLTIWVTKKYKRFRGRRAREWLSRFSKSHGDLFAHWNLGVVPLKTLT